MSDAEWMVARMIAAHFGHQLPETRPSDIPEGAMRVAPGSDAVVWRINPGSTGEL